MLQNEQLVKEELPCYRPSVLPSLLIGVCHSAHRCASHPRHSPKGYDPLRIVVLLCHCCSLLCTVSPLVINNVHISFSDHDEQVDNTPQNSGIWASVSQLFSILTTYEQLLSVINRKNSASHRAIAHGLQPS